MKNSLTRIAMTIAAIMFAASAGAVESPTQYKVELENQLRDRVLRIIDKTETGAIVQVQVNLKRVSSELPGVGIGAEVVPVEFDGKLGSSSIDAVLIRILTYDNKVPDWMKSEIAIATRLPEVNVRVSYEPIKGEASKKKGEITEFLTNFQGDFLDKFVKQEMYETLKTNVKDANQRLDSITSMIRFMVWGVLIGMLVCAGGFGFVIFSVVNRFQSTMTKVLEEKLVPALAQGGRGQQLQREKRDDGEQKPLSIQMPAGGGPGGQKELHDMPLDPLINLLSDCYWTKSDSYASYLWSQMNQDQREKVISSGKVDVQYFSYIRQFEPANLNYHGDARYLLLNGDFNSMNQDELSDWLRNNPEECWRITPLRWDLLPISLPDRIQFSQVMSAPTGGATKAIKVKGISGVPRSLPIKLEVKQLLPSDEEFIWNNAASIPRETRKALRSLAWFARTPLEYRQQILSDLDARQVAEAFAGPIEVLEKIKEALPPKKLEMLEHFLKESQPDRNGDVFNFLVDAGLNAPEQKDEEDGDKAAA